MKTNFSLNILYFFYIKISSILYRIIKHLTLKNPKYAKLMDSLAAHNKEAILETKYIKPFQYEVLKYLPKKFLDVLMFTENTPTDIIFLLRLYKTINQIPEFIEMGEVKIVFICTHNGSPFALGSSFPITPETTPGDFIVHYFHSFMRLTLKAYGVDSIDVLFVKTTTGNREIVAKKLELSRERRVDNVEKRHYSTTTRSTTTIIEMDTPIDEDTLQNFLPDADRGKDPRRFILPLKKKDKQMSKIAAFDIETFVHEGRLYPYAIGIQYMKYSKIRKVIYYYENTHLSIEKNSAELLEKMVTYMTENCKSYTIFAHNLGKFDGILMMSSLFKVLGPHSLMIGKDNSIISIKFKQIKMLDSLRIFPMSLKNLAKQFNVDTQKGELDHSKINIDNVTTELIKTEVLEYLSGDIGSLYECMMKASDLIFDNYKFNITDVYSGSSLAMKHYRTSYLDKKGIPLLPRHLIDTISESYFGGISQVYKSYGRNLHYYDINSLYPWAMTQPMPYEYLGVAFNPKLEDVFGFVYASIYIPQELDYKPIPVRMDDILATPSGHVLGVYFSEELKYAKSIGCQIKAHKAYLFSKKFLFNDYVKDLYAEKSKATGSERVFIKLLLNGLYGFFARTDDKHVAQFLPLDEALEQAQIYGAYNIILMDDDATALLIRDTQPSKLHTDATGHEYYKKLDINKSPRTKSNRAIASATTGYARVRIHQFKDICGDVYYSDTDSIITGNKLSDNYINKDLGFMKDECEGLAITEAIFISPKLYGLRLSSGEEIIKTRGVKHGELNFDDLMKLHKGETIHYTRTQLFKSLNTKSIFQREIKGSVEHKTPAGKIPIYDNKIIIGYKDIHRSIFTAIKENPIGFKLSHRVTKIIKIIRSKLNFKDE